MFRLVFLLFACMTFCFGADDFSSFRPDLSTSDPYLRYLRRIPLSGIWEGAVCFSRDAETIRAFRNRREHPMRKMLVPEALRTEGNNFGLAVAAVYRGSFELPERKPGDRRAKLFWMSRSWFGADRTKFKSGFITAERCWGGDFIGGFTDWCIWILFRRFTAGGFW